MNNFINETEWNNEEGMWIHVLNKEEQESSFDSAQADEIRRYEDVSWWYTYRKQFIHMICREFMDEGKMLVDVGGGNGLVAGYLKKQGYDTSLIEPSHASCRYAIERGVSNVYCGTVGDSSIKNEAFEQVMLLDVLEHIEDDKAFYKMMLDKMASGGRLLITVPAFMKLWSSEDVGSGHYRRYKAEDIRRIADEVGGKVIFENYFFSFLYYPVLLGRVLFEKIGIIKPLDKRNEKEYAKERDRQYTNNSRLVAGVLTHFEKREMKKALKKRLKHGSSLVVIIEKE